MPEEVLLSTKEVLARLEISRPTLYAMIRRKQIAPIEDKKPYLQRRTRLLFREADIERLRTGG